MPRVEVQCTKCNEIMEIRSDVKIGFSAIVNASVNNHDAQHGRNSDFIVVGTEPPGMSIEIYHAPMTGGLAVKIGSFGE